MPKLCPRQPKTFHTCQLLPMWINKKTLEIKESILDFKG
jgi:hypothetical protein